ncbi:MAG: tRNA pseudouridine(55) synthase TruB [Actinobacteria bacterium]|nr:tRNA pseudouridine(55) synthase TruB [Actinomycetota bacterium]
MTAPAERGAVEQRRDGVAVIDKDAGWTSHDVVAKARGILGNKKIGHSGTLDPDATGVLVLGVGRVTRLMRYLTALRKTYTAEIVLGTSTSTLDAAGEVTGTYDMTGVTPDDVRGAATVLTGDILQVPPMVSAVKIGGRRLHELAREGKEVDRAPRPVTVYRFDVEPATDDASVYRARVECSSGTYVRSLAADLGAALGGGAHLRALRRTAIGSFTLADARPLDAIDVLAPPEAMRDYPNLIVDEATAIDVRFGKVVPAEVLGATSGGPWAVLDGAGDLLAVYERHKAGTVKPAVVLADPSARRA